jgi:glyoxylase-like metal-dependent hydrolase (beta-lactamase superfamily II)
MSARWWGPGALLAGALLVAGVAAPGCGGDLEPTPQQQPECENKEIFAQVPASAVMPNMPAKGYLVEQHGDGLYVVTNGVYQMMFLVHEEGVIAVDAPEMLGQVMLPAIAEVTNKPVTHLVYSHAHVDHTAAATVFTQAFPNLQLVAHEETAVLLRKARDPRRPVPTLTFTGETTYTLTAGSQTLELSYKGNNHQVGELFIYAPRQKVLMHVDIVFPGWAPFKALAIAQDIPGLMLAFDQTLEYPFTVFVGGHLGRVGTRQDVEQIRAYMHDLRNVAIQANQSVSYYEATKDVDPRNTWLQFKRYSDAVTEKCVELMPKRWLTELGGADVFLRDNCFTMTESLRID